VASFALAFWLDLFKDTKLATQVPPETQELLAVVQPLLLLMAIAALLAGGLLWYRRGSALDRIRRESRMIPAESDESQTGD